MRYHLIAALLCAGGNVTTAQAAPPIRERIEARINQEYPSLFELYKHLHQNPELSLREEKSAARMAEELRKAGFEVTERIGKHGVVAVLRNGAGPTGLIREDMDALPVQEKTGLPYASQVMATDGSGKEVPVMHACGHDMHMTWLIGTARVLAQCKDQWRGTLVLIAQPAEEAGGGALRMLKDGLFTKFPRPEFCLALHDDAELEAGTVGYTAGYACANVDTVDMIVHGMGGHGAYPHRTRDPVVLAAKIILDLQTIVSREVHPGEAAVVTVGSIHGGSKHNIIPDEVRLQLTVRSYADEVRKQTLDAIRRIARGQALAAGMPEDRLPEVKISADFTPAMYNDPALMERVVKTLKAWMGESKLVAKKPSMGGEDFAEYGRVEPRVPICMLSVGGVAADAFQESQRSGRPLPSLHSPLWAPLPEPTIKTGITVLTASVFELMK